MELNVYLTFNGNAEKALLFYKDILKGEIVFLNRFSDAPIDTPADYKDKIMHAALVFNQTTIMASDALPGQETPYSARVSLSLNLHSVAEINALFEQLAVNGEVTMPLEDTFWNARFGMVKDQFGIHWMLNYDYPSAS